tara:strand:- start:46 stop:1977 length:1932 start_codon:yes stop_codon:yes gene_type:complete
MATTQTTYTGNGSLTNYSFTFEYIKQADVKVTLNTVATTAFTFANATTLAFTTAPANGVAIRIFRDTDINTLNATFFPGSAIKAEDLNNNFTQSHFAVQEADFEVDTANTTANTAKTTADTALGNSETAVTTANSATTTANTANTNASAAVTTANTASTNATTAVNTANTASTNATTAVNTANAATTTANTALTNSRESDGSGGFNTAISVANAASSAATTASTNASAAVTTANAASSTAGTANTNASAAVSTANAASAAVSQAVLFTLIANVASIPGSPSNNDYIEIGNSTGIQSFSPLNGLPSGFVGASGLTVRLRYDSSASSWVFMNYFANDSESRYLTKNIPVVTGDATNGSGQITLNCENNSHGVKIKGPPHSASADYTLTLPNDDGASSQVLSTDGSGVLSWASQPDISGKADTSAVNTSLAAKANIAGPTFTGVPAAPTATSGTNTTQIATTAFVTAAVPDVSGKANLAGPTFTGVPAAPTAAVSTNTTQVATTAFVVAEIADEVGTTVQAFDADTAKTDAAQTYTAAQRGQVTTLTSAASITIDFALSNNFLLTTGHAAILFANPTTEVAGQSGSIFIVQGSTTCAAPTWGNQWFFAGGTAPALTGTTGKVARIDYIVQEAGKIHAVATDNLTYT